MPYFVPTANPEAIKNMRAAIMVLEAGLSLNIARASGHLLNGDERNDIPLLDEYDVARFVECFGFERVRDVVNYVQAVGDRVGIIPIGAHIALRKTRTYIEPEWRTLYGNSYMLVLARDNRRRRNQAKKH